MHIGLLFQTLEDGAVVRLGFAAHREAGHTGKGDLFGQRKCNGTGHVHSCGSEPEPNNRTIFKRLEEQTNVHIDWTAIQSDQWSDKITLNMSTAAAAELLPPLDLPPPQADRAAAEPARAQTLRKLRLRIFQNFMSRYAHLLHEERTRQSADLEEVAARDQLFHGIFSFFVVPS